jgi:hypothetical protein
VSTQNGGLRNDLSAADDACPFKEECLFREGRDVNGVLEEDAKKDHDEVGGGTGIIFMIITLANQTEKINSRSSAHTPLTGVHSPAISMILYLSIYSSALMNP